MQNAMTIDSPRLVRRLKGDGGFSLIELMVATFVTMVVLATTLWALSDGIRAADTAGLVAEMQHNSRTGLNMMTRDLMQAGQGIPIGGIPIPSGAGAVPINRPGPGADDRRGHHATAIHASRRQSGGDRDRKRDRLRAGRRDGAGPNRDRQLGQPATVALTSEVRIRTR